MDSFLQDVRHSLRVLVKSPGFTAVALATLTLGIGVTTAVFSVVNAALLRPLPYPDAERLVRVQEEHPMNRGREMPAFMTSGTLEAWREHPRTLEQIAGYSDRTFTYLDDSEPVRVQGATVSPALFPLLRATPLLGRVFTEDEEASGAQPVAVLSYARWQTHHDADPDVLGRLITLDDVSYSVIGIMPEGFYFPNRETEIWIPLTLTRPQQRPGQRFIIAFSGIARLGDGVSLAQAEAEGQTIVARAEPLAPGMGTPTLRLVGFHDEMVGEVRPALLALMAAVGFVLLIATANLANLMLARGAARQRELAVRAAIGAGRGRLIRQLVTESVALSVIGGGLGLGVAYAILGVLPSFAPADIPGLADAGIDATVLGFALAVSLGAGVLFGTVPALQASRVDLVRALNEGAPQMGGGFRFRRGNRTRSVLVVAEVALALMLLVGAGLLVRSFLTLSTVDPGFDPANVMTAELNLPPSQYADIAVANALFDQVLERTAARPGVEAVGLVSSLPLTPGESLIAFRIQGQAAATSREEMTAARPQLVSPGYLEAMGLRLVAGRFVTDQDTESSPRVFVVNEAFASAYFPGEEAVGQRLNLGRGEPSEIVGIVGDVHHRGLDSRPSPELYFSYRQSLLGRSPPRVSIVARTTGDPLALVPFLRQDILDLNPTLPLDRVMTMGARLSSSVAQPRFYALVLGVFAAGALALAMLGIYGVLAYTVSRRSREIGLRMALGADRRGIRNMVVRQGALLVGVGVALGLAGALVTTRALESLLFGVTTLDLPTLIAVPVMLVTVALAACYLPARRATRVDPMDALRYE
ncbi:MAG: ABC transporter permease [Acidobacteria bacterium]|nr:MAG: ABC transporter permease [Acidobacteriota bacterium]